jgi:hypothetical protein
VTEWNFTAERILAESSKGILSRDLIGAIFSNPAEFSKILIEKRSIATALKFWNGDISFRNGDYIINNLYIFWMASDHFVRNSEFSGIA